MDTLIHSPCIAGVTITPLTVIDDERGAVLHMLRSDASVYQSFGEVYFSEIKPGVVKAWKRHKRMTQNFAVPLGQIKLVIYDNRLGSPTEGIVNELLLGRPDHYQLISFPPMVWYGFQCLSSSSAIVANLTDIPHDIQESEKISDRAKDIPYTW